MVMTMGVRIVVGVPCGAKTIEMTSPACMLVADRSVVLYAHAFIRVSASPMGSVPAVARVVLVAMLTALSDTD